MPHIHTGPGQHDLTASAYILRLGDVEPAIVLHRHKRLARYLQFGGHVELGETPWQAIRHEVLEESGYALDQLRVLQPPTRITALSHGVLHPVPVCYNTHRIGDAHFHTDTAWAFVTAEAPAHPIAEGESRDIRLFTRAELLDASSKDIDDSARDVGRFVLDVCLESFDRSPTDDWR